MLRIKKKSGKKQDEFGGTGSRQNVIYQFQAKLAFSMFNFILTESKLEPMVTQFIQLLEAVSRIRI